MKATYFLGPQTLETRQVSLREPNANEVVIQVAAAGICGTDVHIYHGGKGASEVSPPVVLGHEYAGIVRQVGKNVTTLKPGDKVTVDPNTYCGKCRACRNGKKQFCEQMRGFGVNYDGGFQEYSIVPENQALRLNEDVDLEEGAMSEPLACCLHGIDIAAIRPGDHVVVIGGGPIGQIMAQLARLAGAATVTLSEPVAMRRELALELGTDFVLDPMAGDLPLQLKAAIGLLGADVVIECVGRTSAVEQAFQLTARGGSVLLFSVPSPEATVALPLFDVFRKELRVQGSLVNPCTHQRAVDLLNSHRLQVKPLITHRYGLEQVQDAILRQIAADSVKVIVTPQE